jgi:hypothetical protein
MAKRLTVDLVTPGAALLGVLRDRITRWGLNETPFAAQLHSALDLVQTHPDMALTKCRQILEGCVIRLHQDKIGNTGTRRLEQILGELNRQNLLPRKVVALCEVVRELGNVGAHPLFDDETLTYREAGLALLSLFLVVEWYVRSAKDARAPVTPKETP